MGEKHRKVNGATATAPREHILRRKAESEARKRKGGRPDLLGRFASYLSERRKKQKLTLRELAKRARVPHTNLFQFETLRKNPRLTELALLAKAFDEPLSQFVKPVE